MLSKFFKLSIFGIAIFYILYDVDMAYLWELLSAYSLYGIAIVVMVCFVSWFLLAIRWNYITDYECGIKGSLEASFMAMGLNNILPAKMGEIASIAYLKYYYAYPMEKSLPMKLIERFYDLLMLSCLGLLVFYNKSFINIYMLMALVLILFGGVYSVCQYPKFFLKMIGRRRFLPLKVRHFCNAIVKNIARVSLKKWLNILLLTIILWGLFYSVKVASFDLLTPFDFSLGDILVLFIFMAFGLNVPSLPGGVGVYEASVVFALSLYGIGKEEALSFALITHLIQVLPTTIIAFLLMLQKGFKPSYQ